MFPVCKGSQLTLYKYFIYITFMLQKRLPQKKTEPKAKCQLSVSLLYSELVSIGINFKSFSENKLMSI